MSADFELEHIVDDREAPEDDLLHLFRDAFGGTDSLWPANQRWLAWMDRRLVAHVAVQRRWFIVNGRYYEGWFLGAVCTAPEFQRRRIATELLRITHAGLRREEVAFAVLNCGESVVGFYARSGYKRIADRGTYLREGVAMIDDDPAMAISLTPDFDIGRLVCDSFPFGFDF